MRQMLDCGAGIFTFSGVLAFICGWFAMEGMGDHQRAMLVFATSLLALCSTYFFWRFGCFVQERRASRKTRPLLFIHKGAIFWGTI